MEEWVDDCWSGAETQMMTLAGNDFKHLALSPHRGSSCDSASDEHSHMGEDLPLQDAAGCDMGAGLGRSVHAARRGSMGLRGPRKYSRYAELCKRNSER